MPLLLILVELFVATLAVWVLTFEIALYLRLPVIYAEVAFLVAWVVTLLVLAKPWRRRIRVMGRKELTFAMNTLSIGCLVGLLVLVASRPDADDVGYMYQALVDTSSPGDPFTVDPFIVPIRGKRIEVPFLSENEAYETMVAAIAHLTGIDPLQAYHNAFAFIAAIAWAATYALLFRRFRVPRTRVWMALGAIVTFLLLDGNLHRSFGNFSLLRLWQGKIIAWVILQPAFLLFALRFLARPSRYRFGLLATTGLVSFFVNRSSVFLFAVLGTAIAVSYTGGFKGNRRRCLRAAALVATVAPLWIVGTYAAWVSVLSGSSLSSMWSEIVSASSSDIVLASEAGFVTSWWRSLYILVIGSPSTLARDVFLLTVLPFFVVPRPLHRFVPLLSLAVAVLALSPLTGPAWFYFFPRAYWRSYYALPIPFCVGLAVHLLSVPPAARCGPVTRFALAVVLILSTGLSVDRPALSVANGVELKSPFEYRFRSEPLHFARSVARRLDGKLVLAPNEVANILALTEHDSIDLVYTRASVSRGSAAFRADLALSKCRVNARTAQGLQSLLSRGVDAVVMASCKEAEMHRLQRLLPAFQLEEDEEASNSGYRLFWVRPSRSVAP